MNVVNSHLRRALLFTVLAAALTVTVRASAQGHTGVERGPQGGPCKDNFEVQVDGRVHGCTHGPDPAPPGIDHRTRDPIARPDATTSPTTAAAGNSTVCVGDGSSGPRVQAVYAFASGTTDRYAAVAPSIKSWAGDVEAVFNTSAAETGGLRHVRFVTDANCQVVVAYAALPAGALNDLSTMISALEARGFNRSDRKYLVWADANVYCGIGEVYVDDQVGQANLNTRGDMFSRADTGCWGVAGKSTEAHELMHTLGGVQSTAPHGTRYNHCYDESDRMCYDDGSGAVMQQICATTHENVFDCNHDDYYSTAPSGWLATHWNTASNPYLDATPPASVTAQPATVKSGAATTVYWSGIAYPTATDWIGLYPSSAAADSGFLAWTYTTGTPWGSKLFTIPSSAPAGSSYELRLFSNNGYSRLGVFQPLTVQAGTPASVSASPTTVQAGSSTTVSWSAIANPTTTDWIGLYSSAGAADTSFLTWTYTTGAAAGSKAFIIPSSAPAGTSYQLRLFSNNGYTRLATFSPIIVQAAPPATVSASPTTVTRGSSTTVSWSGIASPTSTDWIGLYSSAGAADMSFLTWTYTTGAAAGSKAFIIPTSVAAGTSYELRLFSNNGYTRLAKSTALNIQ